VDLKKTPLSREELLELSQKVGLDALINRRGTTWRKLELADKNLSEAEMLDVLLENQSMILRPVLVRGESVMIGYDEEAFVGFTASDRPMGA
jgi:arsenate reductase-like glutaredoxin family protein